MPERLSSRSVDAMETIAAASDTRQLGRAFVSVLPQFVDCSAFGITLFDRSAPSSTRVLARNVPDGFVHDYEALGRDNDSLFGYITATGAPVHDQVLFRGRTWRNEPVGSFLRNWGFAHSLQAPVVVAGSLRATLHGTRWEEDRPFDDDDLTTFALLGRAVGRQFRTLDVVEEARQHLGLCEAALDQLPVAAVVTDASLRIERANRAAADIACEGSYNGLSTAFAAAVEQNVAALQASARVLHHTSEVAAGDELSYVARTRRVAGTKLYMTVFSPSAAGTAPASLGARERAIAALVARGSTNEAIAVELGISRNTVKDHLKRINRKLGTTNRAAVAAWAQANLHSATSG